jgi:hypothetical protein
MSKARTAARDAAPTPEEFLAGFSPDIQALADQLRQLIKQTIPNLKEAVYPGWRLIGYREVDGRRSRYFCYIAPLADRVQLGFEYGVHLSDPAGLLEGRGSQVRYVTVRTADDVRAAEIAALIGEAALVAATPRQRA